MAKGWGFKGHRALSVRRNDLFANREISSLADGRRTSEETRAPAPVPALCLRLCLRMFFNGREEHTPFTRPSALLCRAVMMEQLSTTRWCIIVGKNPPQRLKTPDFLFFCHKYPQKFTVMNILLWITFTIGSPFPWAPTGPTKSWRARRRQRRKRRRKVQQDDDSEKGRPMEVNSPWGALRVFFEISNGRRGAERFSALPRRRKRSTSRPCRIPDRPGRSTVNRR